MELNLPRPPEPYLYILMRSDLDSLNPGKMVAQGAHAANQFAFDMGNLADEIGIDRNNPQTEPEVSNQLLNSYAQFEQWESSTSQGFGVTISLGVTDEQLHLVVRAARQANFIAGVTHDPSYPLQDGSVIHSIPLDTCGYVFGDKSDLKILLGQFDLLK